jgi:hypothetical protein
VLSEQEFAVPSKVPDEDFAGFVCDNKVFCLSFGELLGDLAQ